LIALAVSGRAETHLERGELRAGGPELSARRRSRIRGRRNRLLEISRLNAMLALASGDASSAFELAEAARRKAEALQSLQLEGECTAVAALACRHWEGRGCGRTKEHALTIFGRLGAKWHAQELERHW
jgi:hypothetical protein